MTHTSGGTVMVIFRGNRHGEPSSNPGWSYLYFMLSPYPWEWHGSNNFSTSYGKIAGLTGFFKLGMATSLGEEKNNLLLKYGWELPLKTKKLHIWKHMLSQLNRYRENVIIYTDTHTHTHTYQLTKKWYKLTLDNDSHAWHFKNRWNGHQTNSFIYKYICGYI